MALRRNARTGKNLESSTTYIKKANIVSLLKLMGAKRGEQKPIPIVLNRDSELFQSYLEQRRNPRSGEYPFQGAIFRNELSITTPSPAKFEGGAVKYKPSTPSPPTVDQSHQVDELTNPNTYGYKIINDINQDISLPNLGATKSKTTQDLRSESSLPQGDGKDAVSFKNKEKKKGNSFPSFQNQFYKYNKGQTPPPASALFEIIDQETQPSPLQFNKSPKKEQTTGSFVEYSKYNIANNPPTTTSSTIFTADKGSYLTTRRPSTIKTTQKYYMNLVTEQPYRPPKLHTVQKLKNPQHQVSSYKEPVVYYKDLPKQTSTTPPISSEFISNHGEQKVKYVPIDEPGYYYKPAASSPDPQDQNFYYKPVPQESHDIENNGFKGHGFKFEEYEPSFSNSDFASSYNNDVSHRPVTSHSASVSEVEYTTPHPLIYGFVPVKHHPESSISHLSSNNKSPNYFSTPSTSSAQRYNQWRHSKPNFSSNAVKVNPYKGHTTAITKPIRFPYDRRHHYVGRFVSTY